MSEILRRFMVSMETENWSGQVMWGCRALLVLRPDEHRKVWAHTVQQVSLALLQIPPNNLASAGPQVVRDLEQALDEVLCNQFPKLWAGSHHNLGVAHARLSEMRRTGKLDSQINHLNRAISHYKKALQIFTREQFPDDWAHVQLNLGKYYGRQNQENRTENLEKAKSCLEGALEVLDRGHAPELWARALVFLGIVYFERVEGNRSENLEKAITCYRRASQEYTRKKYQNMWGLIQINLGNAYRHRKQGDKAKNIEDAISCFNKALEVYTREEFAGKWAEAQLNLGAAYGARIRGDRKENIERGIHHTEQALEVFTRQDFPEQWAHARRDLGSAYTRRRSGEKAVGLEKAIECYEDALTIFTSKAFAADCRGTARHLGNLFFSNSRWAEAAKAYRTAIEANEILYEASLLRSSQETELAAAGDLYRRAGYALARSGKVEDAVVVLETGRARGLNQVLARDRADLEYVRSTAPEVYERYREAARRVRNRDIVKSCV